MGTERGRGTAPAPDGRPALSIVVLSWENLHLTQACVESLRATCDVRHELVIVDNGSAPDVVAWIESAADVAVLHEENLGFARGMNAGLRAARGEVVAFVNNDTVWPSGWTGPLLSHFADGGGPGIVVPAVTAAGNPVTVRSEPGDEVVVLDPFSALPSGVVYLLRTEVIEGLGGWPEVYDVAMSEDIDLLFTVWANGLDVVIDTRVLVHHELHATLDTLVDDRRDLWRRNFDEFLQRWTTASPEDVPRLATTTDAALAEQLRHARAAATWLRRLDEERTAHAARVGELRRRAQTAERHAAAAAERPRDRPAIVALTRRVLAGLRRRWRQRRS